MFCKQITSISKTSVIIVFFFALILGISDASVWAQRSDKKKVNDDVPDLVWPLPPERPRIRYLGMLSNNLDVEPPKKKGWLQKLINEEESIRVIGLTRPTTVAVDSKGRVFVADPLRSSILVFDQDNKSLLIWGTSGLGRVASPFGLAVDSDDNLYVSDTKLKRVLVFNPEGKAIASVSRIGGENLKNPVGLAIDDQRKRLIVVDSRAHKLFIADLNELDKGRSIGKEGDGDTDFYFPSYAAVDSRGRIYVSDTLNFCVKVFDEDLKFVRRIGQHGTGMGMFDRPKGISVDSDGHIYVVDAAFSNFQIFNDEGQLMLFVGTFGFEPGLFRLPSGIFIDKKDKIYVADSINRRIQIFQYLPET